MNIKKIIGSILLGAANILIFSILPLLCVWVIWIFSGSNFEFGGLTSIIFIISLILNVMMVSKLYSSLFLNSKLKQSVLYSGLISFSWFASLFFIKQFTNFFEPVSEFTNLGGFLMFPYMINFIFISILNVNFVLKSDKDKKYPHVIILEILIHIILFFVFIRVL